MTRTQARSTRHPFAVAQPGPAGPCAATAALLLLAGGAVTLVGGDSDLSDHTQGLGALSEVLTGLAFLSGAVALTLLRPPTGWRALLWSLAPVGLAIAGVSMLMVPVLGAEPPAWLFLLAVLPTLVGMIAAGTLGWRSGLWPWWTGVAVALFLPMMFTLPLNSVPMAAVWVLVWLSSRRR